VPDPLVTKIGWRRLKPISYISYNLSPRQMDFHDKRVLKVAGQFNMSLVRIVLATEHDRADIYLWRNDEITRQFSKTDAPVPWEIHAKWFAAILAAPGRQIWIGYAGADKIGMVRLDQIDGSADRFLVSIIVAPSQRGKGLGRHLLQAAIATVPNSTLDAEISAGNEASRIIFQGCGFEPVADDPVSGFKRYRRLPAPGA
jgi:RimJ/RimL family protein N-acetyltransferase